MTHTSDFAALHRRGSPFLLPNAWDVASALLLAEAGFPAVGTTSLGVTASVGLPDGAGAGAELTVALAGHLVPRLPVPLTVDLEGGYGDDPALVATLAAELAEIGVAGINLEDGRADGRLRSPEQHAAIIGAVTAAAPTLFVNARTDTYWLPVGRKGPLLTHRDVKGPFLTGDGRGRDRVRETVRRLATYRDAGASGVFVPGLTEPAEIATVAKAVDLPLNILWQPGLDLGACGTAGVARVSTGSALYRSALGAALAVADAAHRSTPPPGQAVDYHGLQRLVREAGRRAPR
ncbi:2-methylisocitrate lyase-like PEP mutase family enzyme [Micromonospora pisi]|uniref:2-methylisocitrate lyase-like PEP mutase family enzyme n=1 Tax=Micromonospora pisi TaxID=589240 RepID=A0A495JS69_9ACTN|nr:isocitrate lyase/phosphoenolpyruvate mutase family protein [Micromonospora pisi]RKR91701.1 2-methylisocitrate lyase-like PEP mutase family enzyme [Micromonospora pisi]